MPSLTLPSGHQKPYRWLISYLQTYRQQQKFEASMLLSPSAAIVIGIDIAGGGEASEEAHILFLVDEKRVAFVLGSLLDEKRDTGVVPMSHAMRMFHIIKAVDALIGRMRLGATKTQASTVPLFVVIESNYAYGGYLYQQLFYQFNVHRRTKHVTVFFAPDLTLKKQTGAVGTIVNDANKPPRYDLFETIMNNGGGTAFRLGVIDCFKWTGVFRGLLHPEAILSTLLEQTKNLKIIKLQGKDGVYRTTLVEGKQKGKLDDLYMCASNTFAWIEEFMKLAVDDRLRWTLRCRELEITRYRAIHKTMALQPTLSGDVSSDLQSELPASSGTTPPQERVQLTQSQRGALALQAAMYGAAVRITGLACKFLRAVIIQMTKQGFPIPKDRFLYQYTSKSVRYKVIATRNDTDIDTSEHQRKIVCIYFKDPDMSVFCACPSLETMQRRGCTVAEITEQLKKSAVHLLKVHAAWQNYLGKNHPDPQFAAYANMPQQPMHEIIQQIENVCIHLEPFELLNISFGATLEPSSKHAMIPSKVFEAYAAIGTCMSFCRLAYKKARHHFVVAHQEEKGFVLVDDLCVLIWEKRLQNRVAWKNVCESHKLLVEDNDVSEHINYKIF